MKPDLWGIDGPSCPDGCSPVDISIPFDHGPEPCEICPHVRCAICGAWAEPGDPTELADSLTATILSLELRTKGQLSWLG